MAINTARNARTTRGDMRIGASKASLGAVIAALASVAILTGADGISAANAGQREARTSEASGITLAGRWQGPRFGYGARKVGSEACAGDKPCLLTYDIVACPEGWCGIEVSDATPCGAIGVRMSPDTTKDRRNAFQGKLELAKGAAPYIIEAWYTPPDATKTAGPAAAGAHLHIVGDTGGELLMMRRSFPFQAELTRMSDAQCTLEKATS
jgi:hypothetical protein